MPIGFSEQDIQLLGYSDIKEVGVSSQNRPWQIYKASTTAGVQRVTHTFAYLHSSSSLDDARKLSKQEKISDDFFLITPKSGTSVENLKKIFGKNSNVSILEDLIWEKLDSLFSNYVKNLREGIIEEKYYVAPRSERSNTPQDRLDQTILKYLKGQGSTGCINVICASAGVGKTTLARHVVTQLAKEYDKQRRIPTFVEASHWGKLQLESVDDLWEIIFNSLSNFSHGLQITEELFKHALKQGYLVFIFDGFDELCTQKSSRFNAQEVLQELTEIAKETEAGIVITTRTLFWDAEIRESPEYEVHKLMPFEAPQAKDYFHKYFGSDRKSSDRARTLYQELIKQSQRPRESGGGRVQFVNLPICVGIIASYVKDGGNTLNISNRGTVVGQFLEQILERERARQGLLTTAKEQLQAFEEIAVQSLDEPGFDLELLSAAGFDDADILKLNVHPLINPHPDRTSDALYRFSYDFLKWYLLASYLTRIIRDVNTNAGGVWSVMEMEANGKGYTIEHLVELLGDDGETILGKFYRNVPSDKIKAKSFLFHVAKTMIKDSGVVTAQERTDAIFKIISEKDYNIDNTVHNLFVTGKIDKLDFSDVVFERCIFQDTDFVECKANDSTRFIRCRFSGDLQFEGCKKSEWLNVKRENCTMEPRTSLVWEGLVGKSSDADEDHRIDAMHLALSKFWRHGRLKKSIRKNDWKKGTLGHSIYCQPILDAMLQTGLLTEISISGVSEGGYAFNRDVLRELQLFMDNRQLTGKIKIVYDKINI